MTLFRFDGAVPEINATAYVAPNAIVIGRAFLAKDSSVWFNAVLRGDTEPIRIGVGATCKRVRYCIQTLDTRYWWVMA